MFLCVAWDWTHGLMFSGQAFYYWTTSLYHLQTHLSTNTLSVKNLFGFLWAFTVLATWGVSSHLIITLYMNIIVVALGQGFRDVFLLSNAHLCSFCFLTALLLQKLSYNPVTCTLKERHFIFLPVVKTLLGDPFANFSLFIHWLLCLWYSREPLNDYLLKKHVSIKLAYTC